MDGRDQVILQEKVKKNPTYRESTYGLPAAVADRYDDSVVSALFRIR
jgi:hypothetical protein